MKKVFCSLVVCLGALTSNAKTIAQGPVVVDMLKETFPQDTIPGQSCTVTVQYDGTESVTVKILNDNSPMVTQCTLNKSDKILRADEFENGAVSYGNSNYTEGSDPSQATGCRVAKSESGIVVVNFADNMIYCGF